MTISKELLDELLKGCERPEDLLGEAGLKGFPEAITAAFPDATVQICVRQCLSDHWSSIGSLHLLRHSLNFCVWKDRKAVAADLRLIYGTPTTKDGRNVRDWARYTEFMTLP